MTSWYWLYVLCILFFDFDVSVLMWCEPQLHSQVCDVTATATLLYTTGPRAGTSMLSGDKNTEQKSLKFWNFLSPIIPRRTCKIGNKGRKMIFFISTSVTTVHCTVLYFTVLSVYCTGTVSSGTQSTWPAECRALGSPWRYRWHMRPRWDY